MMTTTSPIKTPSVSLDPDEVCQVCPATREHHGDMNHEFSVDGQLRQKKQPEVARQKPPTEKGQSSQADILSNDPVANLTLRMVERMIAKGQLDGDDLIYIFGGPNANPKQ